MIPQHTPNATVEGSIGGMNVAATVDAEDMAHIMTVLTDLYSDNSLAVLREYSTNARDIHIKSGVKRPIEVTLPSRLSNTLTIRDYGQGQSPEDMVRTYTKYGKSNKRDSAEENGFLGIGSKSALTYTSTFTVVSVKDGMKSQAVIFRDEEGLLHINVVSSVKTDEPSGTVVTIPTKIGDNFTALAERFFMVWDKGTVLVNGVAPKHISESTDLKRVGNHYVRTLSGYRDASKMNVVMGNVTYRVEMETPPEFRVNIEAWTFVPNGSVKFVPSREALDLKPATKAVVDAAWRDMTAQYMAWFTDGLAKAKTIVEAVAVFLPMQRVLGRQQGLVWNGITMQETVRFNGRQWSKGWQNNGIGATQMRDSMSLANAYASDAAFLVNRKSKSSLGSAEKSRLALYLQQTSSTITTVYFNGDDDPILGGVKTLDWNKVLDATKTHQPKVTKTADDWEYWTTDGSRRSRHFGNLPTGKVVLFGSNTEFGLNSWSPVDLNFLNHAGADHILVNVALNRQDKFKRDNPKAMHYKAWLDDFIAKVANSLTADEKIAYKAYDDGNTSLYRTLAGRTDDKMIDTIHATMDAARDKARKADAIMRLARRGSFRVGGQDYITEHYPLADDSHIDHTILYINYIKNGK